MRDAAAKLPGFKWILILAVSGFAAGFVGPMIFVPDANQGPLVGIFITGPAGFVLGAVLWGFCALFKLPAKVQWRMLYATATIGVAMTLLCVQPEPKVQGYVFDGEIEFCTRPSDMTSDVLDYWKDRVAELNWARPRAGWQAEMRGLLRDAPGVVLLVGSQRNNAIKVNRKPWNLGTEFAAGWTTREGETYFHDANGSCDLYPPGGVVRGYQVSDYEDRIRSADIWPPKELLYVLRALALAPVPEKWKGL